MGKFTLEQVFKAQKESGTALFFL